MVTYADLSRREETAISSSPNFGLETRASNVLDLVNLTPLMKLTSGRPEIVIGLVDGPVVIGHPDLASENVREIPGRIGGTCARASSLACMHGTFVAGILCAKRSSAAPAICPDCTRSCVPFFRNAGGRVDPERRQRLAAAIIECDAGALCEFGTALAQVPSAKANAYWDRRRPCRNRGVIVVAAAVNQEPAGSTAITRHPRVSWHVPLSFCCDGFQRSP